MILERVCTTVEYLTGNWAEGMLDAKILKLDYRLRWVASYYDSTWLPEIIVIPFVQDLNLLELILGELEEEVIATIKITIRNVA